MKACLSQGRHRANMLSHTLWTLHGGLHAQPALHSQRTHHTPSDGSSHVAHKRGQIGVADSLRNGASRLACSAGQGGVQRGHHGRGGAERGAPRSGRSSGARRAATGPSRPRCRSSAGARPGRRWRGCGRSSRHCTASRPPSRPPRFPKSASPTACTAPAPLACAEDHFWPYCQGYIAPLLPSAPRSQVAGRTGLALVLRLSGAMRAGPGARGDACSAPTVFLFLFSVFSLQQAAGAGCFVRWRADVGAFAESVRWNARGNHLSVWVGGAHSRSEVPGANAFAVRAMKWPRDISMVAAPVSRMLSMRSENVVSSSGVNSYSPAWLPGPPSSCMHDNNACDTRIDPKRSHTARRGLHACQATENRTRKQHDAACMCAHTQSHQA